MKTSNKLVLAALAVLLVALGLYNNALRAEYRAGSFRDPLRDFVTLPLRDFNALHLEAASLTSVRIQPGPYSVRVSKSLNDVLHVQRRGRELTLGVHFPSEFRPLFLGNREATIIITCPSLAALRTDATYTVKGKTQTDLAQPWDNCRVLVKGFAQDSLLIQADNGSLVELRDNTLHRLRVIAGHATGGPVVRFQTGNHIQQAQLTMSGKSKLVFEELAIPDLRYQFADSATTTLPGRSLSALLPRNDRFK
ncbi:hypothetical protein [Hymenobacter crusticola]|uniref:Uncharacterized protein n=1 Tax=Hymenobacter crusticola TaxID=1770526 RepID=A0A243WAA8_9BACT|nr:hypothetical protein [Hymenobacter crusticola]OUJ72476.1 hypothetical protein BXP70_18105 [Hymenobacter crusticola]